MKKLLFIIGLLVGLCIPLQVQNEDVDYHITKEEINLHEYNKFRDRLGFRESSNRYEVTSWSGTYLGKYQFGPAALKDVGIKYSKAFLRNPQLQEIALFRYLKKNQEYLKYEIRDFVGKNMRGVDITEAGLLAAAHLAGAWNVKKFLYTGGNVIPKDGNGVPVTDYLESFSEFEFDLNTHLQKNLNEKLYA